MIGFFCLFLCFLGVKYAFVLGCRDDRVLEVGLRRFWIKICLLKKVKKKIAYYYYFIFVFVIWFLGFLLAELGRLFTGIIGNLYHLKIGL